MLELGALSISLASLATTAAHNLLVLKILPTFFCSTFLRHRKSLGSKRRARSRDRRAMAHAHLALGAVALVVYIRTMYPTVSGGDAGELMTVACNLGVAHPPGYPLWTWLAHGLATWRGLVPGVATTPAWRVSLLSAFGNAGAATLGLSLIHI